MKKQKIWCLIALLIISTSNAISQNRIDTLREVISDGLLGKVLVTALKAKDIRIGSQAGSALVYGKFTVTEKGKHFLPILITWSCDSSRTIRNIVKAALDSGYYMPPVELAALLRQIISDDDMKKKKNYRDWVVMSDPIPDSLDVPVVLGLRSDGIGNRLYGYDYDLNFRWDSKTGFIFIAEIPEE